MNEIEGIINNPSRAGCLILDNITMFCPYASDFRIRCEECIWYERSSNNAEFKKLIPILLID